MIASVIAQLSIYLTTNLVAAGQVAYTLPVTGASVTTPILLTSDGHGIPSGRVAHGVVSGITGTVEANSTPNAWELTPVDPNTLALSTYLQDGTYSPSVGVNAYTGGGTIQVAFPDHQILFGRQMVALTSAAASPRIVVVPTDGRKWTFEPYGGQGAAPPQQRGTQEQQNERLMPQLWTEWETCEFLLTAAANPPQPGFGDFAAMKVLQDSLAYVMFAALTPARYNVLHQSWPSQKLDAGSLTQRGQQKSLIIEIALPVVQQSLSFVPVGTSLVITVQPDNPLVPTDQVVITIPPEA